jgi:hypothetical protein
LPHSKRPDLRSHHNAHIILIPHVAKPHIWVPRDRPRTIKHIDPSAAPCPLTPRRQRITGGPMADGRLRTAGTGPRRGHVSVGHCLAAGCQLRTARARAGRAGRRVAHRLSGAAQGRPRPRVPAEGGEVEGALGRLRERPPVRRGDALKR